MLLKLEELQDEQIRKALTPKPEESPSPNDERAEALALLHDPKLLDRILADFERCGVVGEETNKLIGYLAAVSRHLECAAGGDRAVELGGRQELADGSGAGLRAGRRARAVLGHDGPVAVLHGRDGSEAQGAGHRRKRKAPARGSMR